MAKWTEHMHVCMYTGQVYITRVKLQNYLGPSMGLLEGMLEEGEETHSMGMVCDFLHTSSVLDVCAHMCVYEMKPWGVIFI